MPISYSWTEQIDTLDGTGAVTATEIKKHSITWQDADRAIYNGGQAGTEAAITTVLGAMALTANQKAEADYTVAGSKAAQLALFPPWFTQASAAADASVGPDADIEAAALAKALAPLFAGLAAAPLGPQYITGPGKYAVMTDGSLLSMDAADEVFRDGVKLPGIFAQTICTFHGKVFAKGKTVPSWWQWNGANWGTAPLDLANYDAGIFI